MAKNVNIPLSDLPNYREIQRALAGGRRVAIGGCVESELAQLVSGLADPGSPHLLLTYNEIQAREVWEDLQNFAAAPCALFPAKDLLFYQADVQGFHLVRRRMEILKNLLEGSPQLVVTTIDALLERIATPEAFDSRKIRLTTDDALDPAVLCRQIVDLGYEHTNVCDQPGEWTRRGSIIDIWPLTQENPCRIEFWDTVIDSLREFDAETQRSLDPVKQITIYPASEKGDENGSLADYFPPESLLFIDEPGRCDEKARAVADEYQESILRRMEQARIKGEDPKETPDLWSVSSIWDKMKAARCLILTGLDYRGRPLAVDEAFTVRAQTLPSYGSHFDLMIQDLTKWQREKQRVLLLCGSRSRALRLAGNLQEYGLRAFYAEEEDKTIEPGQLLVTYGNLHKSYALPALSLVVLSEGDLFGRKRRRGGHRYDVKGNRVQALSDLNVGDYVIHEDHGLGIYRGIEKKIVDNVERDYLKIGYKDGGNLYSPVTQMNRIAKYASADADPPPTLNKLGGAEWQHTKTRVKKAVANIARELVELYAARQEETGYVYGPDTVWQKEFEEQFPYEETEDQLKAIDAVKHDMESGKIMDRLICGDVGFGKTEIAIRAAFKAVQESKQVAFLVPTTILAQQHFNTFRDRMKDYPVRVELLSRFVSPGRQQKVLQDLKKGAVDIVIGTHRLLSRDVAFKDLGLLIIDEEQRFGVSDKEKIKRLRTSVDVLSLTATPIPRTLHMSLIGIRDMSVLEQPPLDRVAIQTYVAEYNDEIVREAIKRELARGGQVYYVSRTVQHIGESAAHIAQLVPDAEIAYAHGQMRERELERVMYDFVNGAIDVLVSTTIIETGLDISNVNTIIIEESDRYGLSQLYQLRGRVGRSNRTAYAFLLYRGGKFLKDVAEKRLQAIRDYTELGSGIRIAMRDLEIRGAGNLLGAEQSGHMEAVGYDLYCKMLGTAIREIRKEEPEKTFDTTIDILLDAHLPSSYIPNENQKMDLYKRIALITCREDYEDLQDELIDRFGELPSPVSNLLRVALLKARAHGLYVSELTGNARQIELTFIPDAPLDPQRLIDLARDYHGALKIKAGLTPTLTLVLRPGEAENARKLLSRAEDLLTQLEFVLKAEVPHT